MIEPTWAKRNVLLDQFELADCSVVDFGCGDQSVLNYQTFREYVSGWIVRTLPTSKLTLILIPSH